MADGISEQHADAQRELNNVQHMGIIHSWWIESRHYYVKRTANSEPTHLGTIGRVEAFLLGCWSTMNGLARRPKARAR